MPQITQPISLGTSNSRQAIVRFDADHTTSDAGVVLLSRVETKLGLCGRFAGAIRDRRNLLFVQHPLATLLRQRIFQIAMGWQDCDDADWLRHDPAFKFACGRAPVTGAHLASQPTLSRLENMVDDEDLARMSDSFLDVYLARHRDRRKRRLIVIDADVTDDRTHGKQEWSHFNAYYDHTCFTPLLIFDGMTDDLLSVALRPGNAGTGDGLLGELERIVPRLKAQWPKAKIRLRADAGFAWPGIFAFCDQNGLEYLVACKVTDKLAAVAADDMAEAKDMAALHGATYRYFGSGKYQSEGWHSPRRVIWKAEASPDKTDLRVIVTNLPQRAQSLYERYCQRGESENWIKAFKRHLQGDRLSCHKATANQFRLLLHAAAYQVMLALRDLLAETVAANWQFDTLRVRLLKVGGWIRQTAHQIVLHLASSHPHQDLWALLIRRTAPA